MLLNALSGNRRLRNRNEYKVHCYDSEPMTRIYGSVQRRGMSKVGQFILEDRQEKHACTAPKNTDASWLVHPQNEQVDWLRKCGTSCAVMLVFVKQ